MALNQKDKARLELELLDKSREIDKYAHQNAVSVFMALFIAIFTLLMPIYFSAMANKNYFLAGFIFVVLLLYIIWFGVKKLRPIVSSFNKKYKMMKKRYKILGISPAELDEELKEMTLP